MKNENGVLVQWIYVLQTLDRTQDRRINSSRMLQRFGENSNGTFEKLNLGSNLGPAGGWIASSSCLLGVNDLTGDCASHKFG